MGIGNGQIVTGESKMSLEEFLADKPGIQTGEEIATRSYYNYPWDCVLRYPQHSEPGPGQGLAFVKWIPKGGIESDGSNEYLKN